MLNLKPVVSPSEGKLIAQKSKEKSLQMQRLDFQNSAALRSGRKPTEVQLTCSPT